MTKSFHIIIFLAISTFLLSARAEANSFNLSEPHEQATLGGGCFWCTEAIYQRIPGVLKVESGYAGGKEPNPSYKFVKSGQSGYAEVIRISFNPQVLSYERILHAFFYAHDPTQLNRQGIDVGHQYRSVVFYHNQQQKELAEKVIRVVDAKKIYKEKVVTEVAPLTNYYPAEDYHQNYFNTYQDNQYCTVDTYDIGQKIEKFFNIYSNLDEKFKVESEETDSAAIKSEASQINAKTAEDVKESLDEEVELSDDVKIVYPINPFHPMHNISYGKGSPEVVQAVIEIQIGSHAKYEVDKATGLLKLDRVLDHGFHFPSNYGFIPQTLFEDGEALDILVISSADLQPLTLAEVRVFGLLKMFDDGEKDYKILSVVDKDSSYSHVNDLKDFDPKILNTFSEYFENYKRELGIGVVAEDFANKEEAYKVINEAIENYKKVFKH